MVNINKFLLKASFFIFSILLITSSTFLVSAQINSQGCTGGISNGDKQICNGDHMFSRKITQTVGGISIVVTQHSQKYTVKNTKEACAVAQESLKFKANCKSDDACTCNAITTPGFKITSNYPSPGCCWVRGYSVTCQRGVC
jgi:hypothetical protein